MNVRILRRLPIPDRYGLQVGTVWPAVPVVPPAADGTLARAITADGSRVALLKGEFVVTGDQPVKPDLGTGSTVPPRGKK